MNSYPTAALGELQVSAQGLGCMGMSEWRDPRDDKESTRTIHRAVDIGVTFLDTADIYGAGHNEELLGRAIRDRHERVVLATKFGLVRLTESERAVCGRPSYVRRACEASLRRLRVDHIDLYYQHRADPDVPIEETIVAMAKLVSEGKIRHVGLSEVDSTTIRRAHAVHPITAVQAEWSLWTRGIEADVRRVCRELNIGVVACSPLSRGLLTGRIHSLDDLSPEDDRRRNPRFTAGNLPANVALVANLRPLAAKYGITVAQLALAWLSHQGPDVVPIPGTQRPEQLDENSAASYVRLSVDDLHRIEEMCPATKVSGSSHDAVRARFLAQPTPPLTRG